MRFSPLKYRTDEDLDNRIYRGLLLREPNLDIVRVQDVGLRCASDSDNLAFAAGQGRILLTHDVSTMPRHVDARLSKGEAMPGVFEVPRGAPTGVILADLLLLAACSFENEWEGRIIYLPL